MADWYPAAIYVFLGRFGEERRLGLRCGARGLMGRDEEKITRLFFLRPFPGVPD